MYFYHTTALERQKVIQQVFGFPCECSACQIDLPTETLVDEDNIIRRLEKSMSSNYAKNKASNVAFKELLESYKRSNFGIRKVAIENLFQLMFMPYQKDYTVLYDIAEEVFADIEMGTFSF